MWRAQGTTADAPASLVLRLRRRAADRPRDLAATFLTDGECKTSLLTYADLYGAASCVASCLIARYRPGDRVVIALEPGVAYIQALVGCFLAGIIAVPVYPPRLNSSPQEIQRLERIAASCYAACVLTSRTIAMHRHRWAEHAPFLRRVPWHEIEAALEEVATDPGFVPRAETVAFLQYTSGSTSDPKGVIVTHGNLMENFAAMAGSMGVDESSILLSWLPFNHDMGLIGIVLQALFFGCTLILMSPVHFLQRPMRWLAAIDRYRATHSGGPNFAYDLCVRRTTREQRATLDLSSWRVAFNGAEPVRPDTIKAFADGFAESGFSRNAFLPCYGLAEATLYLSSRRRGNGPLMIAVDRKALLGGKAMLKSGAGATELVSCGFPPPGHEVAIVDPESCTPLPDGIVGEIWARGPSIASGYWGAEASTRETFEARLVDDEIPLMRTGDLGFRLEGELYVTGRLKDLLILRGRNIYPQDIELTIEQAFPAVPPVGGAAFGEDVNGEDRLILVQEIKRGVGADLPRLARSIAQTVLERHEIQAYRVVLIRSGSLPKTTSGKVRRSATRQALANGELPIVAEYCPGRSTLEAGGGA
jgi:acyl-CoA synthetase (AMP-forming)/AMP-acid ligase II